MPDANTKDTLTCRALIIEMSPGKPNPEVFEYRFNPNPRAMAKTLTAS
jgi:hypothetical protein